MQFKFFDPKQRVDATRHHLPHWEQQEVTYFITFRTADSLPKNITGRWLADRNKWLRRHGIDPKDPDWHSRLHDLEPAVEDEFHDKFSDQFHRYLDTGYGECVLRRPEAAEIVADSLSHFDGERYLLGDLVAMPNHVHLLVMLFLGTQLPGQCYSWKKYTAGKVNELLGRKGHFWQTESYDRIVRDQEELEHYRKYIAADPRNARLTCGEYVHWRRP